MAMRYFLLFPFLLLPPLAALAQEVADNPRPFAEWLAGVRSEALEKGISEATLDAALVGIEPVDRIIELDRKQPETTMTLDEYLLKIVNDARVQKGKEMHREYSTMLNEISNKYGVQPAYIVALWGIETNYGQNTGSYNVVEALATLAYDGRRSDYFRKELFNALTIIDGGNIAAYDMVGSWAGAMGQCQFMPSSYNTFAVDYNGDGKRDIWNNQQDLFASIANYLSTSGWNSGENTAVAVRLPEGFDDIMADIDEEKSITEWKSLGVTREDGSALPDSPEEGSLIFADATDDSHPYLVYNNYKVILKWNRSRYFATAVGMLANQIEQGDI